METETDFLAWMTHRRVDCSLACASIQCWCNVLTTFTCCTSIAMIKNLRVKTPSKNEFRFTVCNLPPLSARRF